MILDDDTDFLEDQKNFFIHTNTYNGLSFDNFCDMMERWPTSRYPDPKDLWFVCEEMHL